LQEGASCPWEKERVSFGSAGLKFHACRRELAATGEKEKVIFGNAGLKFHVCRKERAIFGSARLKFHICRKELNAPGRRRSSLVLQDKISMFAGRSWLPLREGEGHLW
jgi:hypothetical protein